MIKKRKIPLRVCAGCQAQKSKKEMTRIVRTPENVVEIDESGKKAGRGVYVCRDAACLEKAYKEHRLERSLKTNVSEEIYESLRQSLT
ncbi:RNase P modulator RnpM [Megasphaera vaginalis (ex Srinivasan et al. 2021)]|uniref:PF04296 family protein n=1 Tax=Megasphaera vaginalis (ex Srinivasan et al. 2021) TaxID=1111454 RepID=U7UEA3_9FIRM|nr:PF04296 family protein [Megasphaera vaginalis (ex Srinivasan et al. 2021)]